MRTEDCRKNIDKAAEACDLKPSTVAEVKQATKFCDSVPEFSDCATDPIIALIRIKDEDIKNRAILLAKKALIGTTPTGGRKHSRLTEPEIKKFIRKATIEIKGKPVKEKESEKKDPVKCASPQPDSIPASPPDAPIAQTLKEKYGGREQVPPPLFPLQTVAEKINADIPVWDKSMCLSGTCPDIRSHYQMNKLKNRMECDLQGVDLPQISHCPVIDNLNKAALLAQQKQTTEPIFMTAAGNPSMPVKPKVDSPATPLMVTVKLSKEQVDVLKQIQDEGLAESYEKAILWLIDEARERRGT